MAEFVWELPGSALPVPAGTESAIALTHGQSAVDRLPQQFKTKPKIVAIMLALCAPMDQLAQAFIDVIASRNLEVATGRALELLAKLVGQPNIPVVATTLKGLTRARIRANKSSGLGDQALVVCRMVLTDYSIQPVVVASGGALKLIAMNHGRGGFSIVVDQPDIPWDLAEVLVTTFLRGLAGTGIRAVLEFCVWDGTGDYDASSSEAFRLGDSLGSTLRPGAGLGSTTDAALGGRLYAAI